MIWKKNSQLLEAHLCGTIVKDGCVHEWLFGLFDDVLSKMQDIVAHLKKRIEALEALVAEKEVSEKKATGIHLRLAARRLIFELIGEPPDEGHFLRNLVVVLALVVFQVVYGVGGTMRGRTKKGPSQ